MGRVVTVAELERIVLDLRARNQRISFANGHFDLLHVGHLRYLQGAKDKGDVLVVAVNGDLSVERHKGRGHPLVPSEERAELLAAFSPVDYVVVFDEDSPASLLTRLQPEVHCKGMDYEAPERVPEYETVRSYGGETVLVGDRKSHSTRWLIARLRELEESA